MPEELEKSGYFASATGTAPIRCVFSAENAIQSYFQGLNRDDWRSRKIDKSSLYLQVIDDPGSMCSEDPCFHGIESDSFLQFGSQWCVIAVTLFRMLG